MGDALQKAINCLNIRDVYLRTSTVMLADNFEPLYDAELGNLEVQFKHVVTHSNILELNEDEGNTVRLFRVFVELGARWVLPAREGEDNNEVKAHIEGEMVAEYQMDQDPGKDGLKEFALKNASYHIWPFWREYLSSQCLRMNLPKLLLPIKQFANNRDTDPVPPATSSESN